VPRPYAPVPRGRLRDRPAIPGLDPAAGRRRAPRGHRAAGVARAAGQASLDPTLLAAPRHSYDQTVARGISVNLSRPWHKGNHPGLVLARRLKRTAAQVWLFAARLDIPATSNGSENASLLNLYAAGRLKLDELITRRYGPDDVSQAYADMRSGVNIRGVVDFIPAG
jgi:threonine dehydrogenase-like Zn-dependent dehydrogenase